MPRNQRGQMVYKTINLGLCRVLAQHKAHLSRQTIRVNPHRG